MKQINDVVSPDYVTSSIFVEFIFWDARTTYEIPKEIVLKSKLKSKEEVLQLFYTEFKVKDLEELKEKKFKFVPEEKLKKMKINIVWYKKFNVF